MTGPVKPEEIDDLKTTSIPDGVCEVFNALIAENYRNGCAIVKQNVVAERIAERLECAEAEVFAKGWLDVEQSYRKAGWSVEYDRPGYNETYEASFTFRKKGWPMRWRVRVELTRSFEVEVEAADWSEACNVAREQNEAEGHAIECDVLEQLGEPWLKSACWYDLHGPADIVVAEPSFGHRFSTGDIDLLKNRLEAMGLEVFDSWNGVGCTTVSFRCRGRIGTDDFTDDQHAAICAPRPASTQ